jgi:hypothetical protein
LTLAINSLLACHGLRGCFKTRQCRKCSIICKPCNPRHAESSSRLCCKRLGDHHMFWIYKVWHDDGLAECRRDETRLGTRSLCWIIFEIECGWTFSCCNWSLIATLRQALVDGHREFPFCLYTSAVDGEERRTFSPQPKNLYLRQAPAPEQSVQAGTRIDYKTQDRTSSITDCPKL